jgi:hypothetical protein
MWAQGGFPVQYISRNTFYLIRVIAKKIKGGGSRYDRIEKM